MWTYRWCYLQVFVYHGRMTNRPSIDESIELVDYDADWPMLAKAVTDGLRAVIGEDVPIEHIGSTAVPGMKAKPIIDIMVGLRSREAMNQMAARLDRIGWTHLGEAGVSGRLYLRRRDHHSVNVHLVIHATDTWSDNIILRDYLVANPAAARAYEEAKVQALRFGGSSLLSYSDSKASAVTELLCQARRWRKAAAAKNSK